MTPPKVFDGQDETLIVEVGLVGSLFVKHSEASNEAVLAIFEDYLARYGHHLKSFVDGDTDRRRPFGPRERDYARRRMSKGTDAIYVYATGREDLDHASVWQVQATMERSDDDYLSCIWWSIDPTSEPAELLELFLSSARRGRFLHGYAGCGIVPPIAHTPEQMSRKTQLILAKRFAGLDVVGMSLTALQGHTGLKCINWLTLVDDTLLETIGGREGFKSRLAPPLEHLDLRGGIVVQAGPRPVSGDVNRPDELAAYRASATILRPVFAEGGPDWGKFNHLDGLFDSVSRENYTEAWRNRFFPGAKWPP